MKFNELMQYISERNSEIYQIHHYMTSNLEKRIINEAKKIPLKEVLQLSKVNDKFLNKCINESYKNKNFEYGRTIETISEEYRIILGPKEIEFYMPKTKLARRFKGSKIEEFYNGEFSRIQKAIANKPDLPF